MPRDVSVAAFSAPLLISRTDPTEEDSLQEVVPADWWERLKAAPAADVEKAKEFCTSGKLKEVAYESLDGVTTLLDAVGPFLPPPGNTAATLLSGLCKCVHGAHVNNTNLEKLRNRCLDLLDLVLQLGHTDAFISTSRDSSELPKLFKGFTRIMNRFQTFLKEAKAYCEKYTEAGILKTLSRFLLHAGHKEDYEELVTELRDLRASEWPQDVKQLQPPFLLLPFLLLQWTTWWLQDDATVTLGVYLRELLEEVVYKLNAGMPSVAEANSVELPAKPTEDASCVAPVRKERTLKASQAQPEQGRLKVSPVQGGAQLFLSYRVPETGRKRHGGDRTVPLLKSALESHGYSVFVGESDIEGGASWAQAIQVAITDCQVFIPVCSKTYGGTKWTLRELHAADDANKEILPLWHSGDYPPKEVSIYLGNLQRLPRGNQPLVQADFKSLVSDLVAAVKKAGCLPRNPPGPSNQALQGLALDQGRKRI